ncbi:hypothetical protein KFZ70_09435 [Tamlana fucoidanivorans]|uniref:Uncharacterized protein n=1 Tax=Allotamlana fucoidanivorans TaxID=2583814 RepID=A0A5C4SQ22_9FLAO|nr:hypothetical protein [Tamlana fucoidanivorans]TNJ46026.1 hypothetical protein FGF67_03250 [Tamlana fucoidanivorans]
MRYQIVKTMTINNLKNYDLFVNWVVGEFDLYLIDKNKTLNIYFPNGYFEIGNIKSKGRHFCFTISIYSKSKIAFQRIVNSLESIYEHVSLFVSKK